MVFFAVAYARFVYPDGSADVKFLISKSRIVPLKFLIIPRLELNAAVVAAPLGAQVLKKHDIIFNKQSTTQAHQIHKPHFFTIPL